MNCFWFGGYFPGNCFAPKPRNDLLPEESISICLGKFRPVTKNSFRLEMNKLFSPGCWWDRGRVGGCRSRVCLVVRVKCSPGREPRSTTHQVDPVPRSDRSDSPEPELHDPSGASSVSSTSTSFAANCTATVATSNVYCIDTVLPPCSCGFSP